MAEVSDEALRALARRLWERRDKDLAEVVDGLTDKPTNDPKQHSLGKVVKEIVGLSTWSIFLETYSNRDDEEESEEDLPEEKGDAKNEDLELVGAGVRDRLNKLYNELDRREKVEYKLPPQS